MSPEAGHPTDALLALVYGELSADETRNVQRHVDGCATCSATVAGYQGVRGAVAALPRELPSAAGLESLLHYGERAAARARVRRGLRWVWPLAAGVLAVWVAVVAVRPPAGPVTADALARREASVAAPGTAAPSTISEERAKPVEKALKQAEARNETAGVASAGSGSGAVRAGAPQPLDASAQASGTNRVASVRRAAPASKTEMDLSLRQDKPAPAPTKADGLAEAKLAASPALTPPAEKERAARDEAMAPAEVNLAKKSVAASPLAPKGKEALPPLPAQAASSAAALATAGETLQGPGVPLGTDQTRRATLYVRLRESKGAQLLPVLSELCGLEARLGHAKDALGFCQRVVKEYPGTPEAAAAQRQIEILRGG